MTDNRIGRGVAALVGIGLVAAALATELRKPARQRTWHGHIAGLVPYNFHPLRLSQSLWNPDSDRLLSAHGFGVGWSVNFAAVARRLRNLGP